MSELPDRKNMRLQGFDYSQNGAYFVTICTKNRQCLLGRVIVGSDAPGAPRTELSEHGACVRREIVATPCYYEGVQVDHYIVMPNHVHMLIVVGRDNGAPRASRPTTALIPTIVAALKKKTNRAVGFSLWQASYHDHIIRDESDYLDHWQYIDENPMKWREDRYFIPEA